MFNRKNAVQNDLYLKTIMCSSYICLDVFREIMMSYGNRACLVCINNLLVDLNSFLSFTTSPEHILRRPRLSIQISLNKYSVNMNPCSLEDNISWQPDELEAAGAIPVC